MTTQKDQNQNNKIQFRDESIKEKMRRRCGVFVEDEDNFSESAIARQCIKAYLYLMESTLQRINLTEAEAGLLCDAMNGTIMLMSPPEILVQTLYPEVFEFMRYEREESEQLDFHIKKWDCDYDALLKKVKNFTPTETMAVCDAIEQFWKWSETYSIESTHDQLVRVGLIKEATSKKVEMKFNIKVGTDEDAQLIFNAISDSVGQALAENGIEANIGFERL